MSDAGAKRAETLEAARTRRSAAKRAAVEDAIKGLLDRRQVVTFVSVARAAKVSRQYLYNNFSDEIGRERTETRAETAFIDGVKVPLRTPEEYRHIEAALRNKLTRLEAELKEARAIVQKERQTAERERGKVEYWRSLYAAAIDNRSKINR